MAQGQAVRLREIEKAAQEMGVTLTHAVGARRAYLWREWEYWLYTGADVLSWDVLCKPMLAAILEELYQLKRDLYFKNRPVRRGEITEEMVEKAVSIEVTRLVEFTKGRALAWCHEDKRPSLYIATRKNRVICPVCDLHMNPIDILRKRDGMSYQSAVTMLASMY